MRTKIQKWGNSLALRIPKLFARQSKIEQGSQVDLQFIDGRIVIIPIQEKEYKLDELLSEITAENIHDEVDFGDPIGRENW